MDKARYSGKEESSMTTNRLSAASSCSSSSTSSSKYRYQSSTMNSETLDKLLMAEKNLFHAGQATREAWKLIGREMEGEPNSSGIPLSSPSPGTHSSTTKTATVHSLPRQSNSDRDVNNDSADARISDHERRRIRESTSTTSRSTTTTTTTTITRGSGKDIDIDNDKVVPTKTRPHSVASSASFSSCYSSSSSISSSSSSSTSTKPTPASSRSPCPSSFSMEIPRPEPLRGIESSHHARKTHGNGIPTSSISTSSATTASLSTSGRASTSSSNSQSASAATFSRYSYSQPSKTRPQNSPLVTNEPSPVITSMSSAHSRNDGNNNNNNDATDLDGSSKAFSLGGKAPSGRNLFGYNRESRSISKSDITVYTFTVKKSDGMLELLGSKRSSIQIQVDTESRILTFLSPHDSRDSYSCAAVTAKPQSKLGMHLKIQTGNASLTKKINFLSNEDRLNFMDALEQGKVMLKRKTSGLNPKMDARSSSSGSNHASLDDSALFSSTSSSKMRLQETVLNDHFEVLPGEQVLEHVQRVTHLVVMSANDRAVQGVLKITSYRITFAPYDGSWKFGSFEVPLAAIENISRDGLMLSIQSRDLRTIRLAMHDAYSRKKGFDQMPSTPDIRWLNLLTMRMKPPSQINNLFAFAYHTEKANLRLTSFGKRKEDGWLVYSPVAEYQRLGFLQGSDMNNSGSDVMRDDSCMSLASTRSSNSCMDPASTTFNGHVSEPITWRLLKNSKFRFSPTYPQLMIVPTMMSEEQLVQSARFRSRARLPVVVWRHPKNKSVLARSSQPNYGMAGNRSEADRLLLRAYRDSANRNSANMAPPLHIVDARKPIATKGNRLKGKGVENSQHYDNAIIEFMGIANIHKMRESLDALKALISPHGVEDGDKHYHNRLENTRWLKHVMRVISGARRIAQILHEDGASVLVHCSDGWDRTPQLVALAQLILDPYYRTIRGFAVLVEKEWCSFGHKFADRVGVGKENNDLPNERSPVMLQFLDCVWQMTRQFPTCFEFNEQFLLHVADSLISGLYGTFLYNSERERIMEKVWERTESVWTPVLEDPKPYKNALYRPTNRVLYPRANLKRVVLWDAMFYRWDPENNPDYMDTVELMPEQDDGNDDEDNDQQSPDDGQDNGHRDRTYENLLNASPELLARNAAAREAEEKALRLEIDVIQDFDELRSRSTVLSDCSSLSDEEDMREIQLGGFRRSSQIGMRDSNNIINNNNIEESGEMNEEVELALASGKVCVILDEDAIERYRRGVDERTKQRAQARNTREALHLAPDASRIKYLEQLLSESVARELQLEAELDSLHNQTVAPRTPK